MTLRSAAACRRFESGAKAPHSKGLLAFFIIALLSLPNIANACPVCFGGANSISKGMDAAIWFLIAVLVFVQIGFVALFWSFWRRAKALRRRREQFHLIEGGAR